MTKNDDDRAYDVGYGKPPKASRFKKGQSGNPRGRPKGSKDVNSILLERLYSKITITENGRRKQITVIEGIFRRVSKSALEGDRSALNTLIKLLPLVQSEFERRHAAESETPASASANDQAVLESLASMFGQDLDDLLSIAKEDDPDD